VTIGDGIDKDIEMRINVRMKLSWRQRQTIELLFDIAGRAGRVSGQRIPHGQTGGLRSEQKEEC